ncbi:MAG: hypothetical protein RR585_08695 [Coprobacillus sp.]
MNQVLLGKKKHGCFIDNDNKILEYRELLSFFEKINGKDKSILLSYNIIDHIDIYYSIVNGPRFGSVTFNLSVYCKNNQVHEFPIFFFGTKRQDYTLFANLLVNSGLSINDPHHILNSIIEQPNEHIGTIIDKIDKGRA